jgi:hypothetical protein
VDENYGAIINRAGLITNKCPIRFDNGKFTLSIIFDA